MGHGQPVEGDHPSPRLLPLPGRPAGRNVPSAVCQGREVTSILGDLDALALGGEISTRVQTAAQGPKGPQTEPPGGASTSAPGAPLSRVVLGSPSWRQNRSLCSAP